MNKDSSAAHETTLRNNGVVPANDSEILKATVNTSASLLDLDNLNFSSLPQWLVSPVKFLVKTYRGESEDGILKSFINLEMVLHPVS